MGNFLEVLADLDRVLLIVSFIALMRKRSTKR